MNLEKNLQFSDPSGEIHYSCESIDSKANQKDIELNKKTTPTIGWDFTNNARSNADFAQQFDRHGPDLFVQNGIPTTLAEPIYAEIKKKPASIFQVRAK